MHNQTRHAAPERSLRPETAGTPDDLTSLILLAVPMLHHPDRFTAEERLGVAAAIQRAVGNAECQEERAITWIELSIRLA